MNSGVERSSPPDVLATRILVREGSWSCPPRHKVHPLKEPVPTRSFHAQPPGPLSGRLNLEEAILGFCCFSEVGGPLGRKPHDWRV